MTSPPRPDTQSAPRPEAVIHEYYRCFNDRRLRDVARLVTDDAVFEHIPSRQQQRGVEAYVRFADSWLAAFPDAVFTVQRIEPRGTMFDVHVLATGSHLGVFDIGHFKFKPTRMKATLRFRELLHLRDGKITASIVSFDINDIIQQLSVVDYAELTARLVRIAELSAELDAATGDASRQREVADRLGPELDAARRALRPHYSR